MTATFDAPQADRLDLVRRVVEALLAGARGANAVAAHARIAPRYAGYAAHAARLLDLVVEDASGCRATATGAQLLATARGSRAEREVFRQAFRASRALSDLYDTVLGEETPTREEITELLLTRPDGSLSTALRRASTLLAWRQYIVQRDDGPQLRLAAMDWPGDLDAPAAPSTTTPTLDPTLPSTVSAPAAVDDDEGAEDRFPSTTASGEYLVQPEPSEPSTALPDTIAPPPPPPPPAPDAFVPDVRVSAPAPTRDAPGGLVDDGDLAYLRRQMRQGGLVLLTGAGFSVAASDVKGRPLPSGPALARELFALCYGQEPYDDSTLQDVFEHAHRRQPKALAELLQTRLVVTGSSLPEWYETWFRLPWAKVYTLNVDDLELAAGRRFKLPRPLRAVSALHGTVHTNTPHLDVVHLNGIATDGPDRVTFSTTQYAERLARHEPVYAELAAEMLTRSIVFVGSPLEEPLLWQHIAMREIRPVDSEHELRPKSFLVSPTLNGARKDKLREHNVVWIKATAEQFATLVLQQLDADAAIGHAQLRAAHAADAGDETNIVDVAAVAVATSSTSRRTEFLLGEEPDWADVRTGRAIDRDEDGPRLKQFRDVAVRPRDPSTPVTIVAVTATAGAGKTTLLMKAALHLHAAGVRVAWVGSGSDVAPPALSRFYRPPGRPPVLVLDDAGRYGAQLIPTIAEVANGDSPRLIVLSLHSYQEHLLDAPAAAALRIQRLQIGRLTDGDINRLLAALEGERRLGALRELPLDDRRRAFQERADRQILVAMIEATSGVKFEEKIIQEWQRLDPVAGYVYALTALATTQGYPLTRAEILLACSGGTREMDAIRSLHRAHLLAEDEQQRYRVRHRVIAETLLEELTARGTQLERLVIGICRALAIESSNDDPRSSRRKRVLKRLLNHDPLLRLLGDVELARGVYVALEQALDRNHHFWLQRGCLELEAGDVHRAENFLKQAAAINPHDPLVETAFAHMQLRKALANPAAPGADELVETALEKLRSLIAARGATDHYPSDVFGRQVLGWCNRAGITAKVRGALIREAKEIVGKAVVVHRSRRELRQLLDDLTKEEMRPR